VKYIICDVRRWKAKEEEEESAYPSSELRDVLLVFSLAMHVCWIPYSYLCMPCACLLVSSILSRLWFNHQRAIMAEVIVSALAGVLSFTAGMVPYVALHQL
jgi:hypothetical protein